MIIRLGIGIATCNRREVALATAQRVMAHTQHPYTLVVADDGSRDGSAQALRAQRLAVAEGQNRGTAWNKNRILFYLMELARCDIAIVLEDDTFPVRDGWERDWILACARHGHVNLAAGAALNAAVAGNGSGEQPLLSPTLVSHCSAFSREATRFAGYFDTRFVGCGFENIEYAQRLLRNGYGGEWQTQHDTTAALYYAVSGGVSVTTPPSFVSEASWLRNRATAQVISGDDSPRACWRDHAGMDLFRSEMATAFPRLRQHVRTGMEPAGGKLAAGAKLACARSAGAGIATDARMPAEDVDAAAADAAVADDMVVARPAGIEGAPRRRGRARASTARS